MPEEFSEKALIAALTPLGEYLNQVVVCGSWTLFIYRRWVLKTAATAPVRTLDVDLAVPKKLPVLSEPLGKQLKSAHFTEKLLGNTPPPIIHFELAGSPYLEFVTPYIGNREQGSLEVQPGVTAQELRYLEIVLENFREVPIPGTRLNVRVTTPAAYLFQKGLSFVKRSKPDKKAKDLAYLFDLIYNLPQLRSEAIKEFPGLVKRYGESWYGTFLRNLATYFPDANGEGVAMVESQRPEPYAAMVSRDATNGPAQFQQAVFRTFSDLLADLKTPTKRTP